MTAPETTKLRPAEPRDVAQVAALFSSVFRPRSIPKTQALETYLSQLMFTHPNYTAENGSMVSADEAGNIKSALTIVPLTYRVGEDIVTARLACGFMASQEANARAAAALIFQIRPRGDNISFSNSAAPVSVAHLKAIGGIELPVQGLRWYRMFKPLPAAVGYIRTKLFERFPRLVSRGPLPDNRLPPGTKTPDGYSVFEATPADFADHANRYLARYTVAPVYKADHIEWAVAASTGEDGRGRLTLAQVHDENGLVCGVFSFVGEIGGSAQILDLLYADGSQDQVLDAALLALKRSGFAFVSAQTRPDMIRSLSRYSRIWYRYVTGVSATCRSPIFKEAMKNGQAYLGGIGGEGWSRLTRDFY